MPHNFACETCGTPCKSKVPRRFCSVRCRANSPDFKIIATRNAAKARAAKAAGQPAATRRCEWCDTAFRCQPARATRFCSRAHYRAWLASIFDNYIAVLDTVPRLRNFDEFLDRDLLDCPIPDCGWQGEDLGHHVGMAHGIPAAKFKERCGFNASTGLIGRKLAMRLSERARGAVPFSIRGHGPKRGSYAMRTEAAEHYEKAMCLRRAVPANEPVQATAALAAGRVEPIVGQDSG